MTGGSFTQANIPFVLDDVAAQCDGNKGSFVLTKDGLKVTTAIGNVDSKDVDVSVNGQALSPYCPSVDAWLPEYDGFSNEFRVWAQSNDNVNYLTIYNSPASGEKIAIIARHLSASKQKRLYPIRATTIALGD